MYKRDATGFDEYIANTQLYDIATKLYMFLSSSLQKLHIAFPKFPSAPVSA